LKEKQISYGLLYLRDKNVPILLSISFIMNFAPNI
jgi:hypothetical protein